MRKSFIAAAFTATSAVALLCPIPASAAVPISFCSHPKIGTHTSKLHTDHWDSWEYIAHYRISTGAYYHVWDNLTHDYVQRKECSK